ncbi:MAG TPA: hypothetical protein PLX84_11905, partial [Acidiphilium sp.]|nr:hypothetical protein [Acidiphilium sp.]
ALAPFWHCMPPRRFAWLIRVLPPTAAIGAQIRHLLDDPAMVALIAARPATGRALRPLCHLLGLRPPPHLRRPARPRRARARVPRKNAPNLPHPPAARSRTHTQAPVSLDAPSLPPLADSPFILPPGNRTCPISPDLRLAPRLDIRLDTRLDTG